MRWWCVVTAVMAAFTKLISLLDDYIQTVWHEAVWQVTDSHSLDVAQTVRWYGWLLPSSPLSERRYCVARRHAVTLCVCVCSPNRLCHVSTARHISLGGEGNALYPALSSFSCIQCMFVVQTDHGSSAGSGGTSLSAWSTLSFRSLEAPRLDHLITSFVANWDWKCI